MVRDTKRGRVTIEFSMYLPDHPVGRRSFDASLEEIADQIIQCWRTGLSAEELWQDVIARLSSLYHRLGLSLNDGLELIRLSRTAVKDCREVLTPEFSNEWWKVFSLDHRAHWFFFYQPKPSDKLRSMMRRVDRVETDGTLVVTSCGYKSEIRRDSRLWPWALFDVDTAVGCQLAHKLFDERRGMSQELSAATSTLLMILEKRLPREARFADGTM